MSDLVSSQQDVIKNVVTMRRYQNGNSQERAFHDSLIRKGRLFVAGVYEGRYAFAPSRFAGYKANSRSKHDRSEDKDGRITNPALDKILGRPLDAQTDKIELYSKLNAEFFAYCRRLAITPDNIPNPRKFWLTSEVIGLSRVDGSRIEKRSGDAIDDIGADHAGTKTYDGKRYLRDPKVRKAVIARAAGFCEYCNEPGFLDSKGKRYLESHHIIALASDGADRLTNVIALCPNDHREAHFGKQRRKLETEMIRRLAKLAG